MGTVVRALNSITIGVDKNRREIAPGQLVELDDGQLAELKSHNPPCIQDPRDYDREQQELQSSNDGEGRELVSRVAEPETPVTQATAPQTAAKPADANVDRSKPPSEDKDEL